MWKEKRELLRIFNKGLALLKYGEINLSDNQRKLKQISKKLTYQNIYKHKIKGIQFSNKKVKVSNRKKKAISINFLKSKFTRRQKY